MEYTRDNDNCSECNKICNDKDNVQSKCEHQIICSEECLDKYFNYINGYEICFYCAFLGNCPGLGEIEFHISDSLNLFNRIESLAKKDFFTKKIRFTETKEFKKIREKQKEQDYDNEIEYFLEIYENQFDIITQKKTFYYLLLKEYLDDFIIKECINIIALYAC